MAKAKTKEKASPKAKAPKAEKAPAAETHKYGIGDLAKILDLKEASVRVKLRNAKVPKTGKAYGWNTKGELEEVAKQLSSEKKAA